MNINLKTTIKTKKTIKTHTPRGPGVALPWGSLPEVISPYMLKLIKKTGGINGPLGRQFVAKPEMEQKYYQNGIKDPLIEDKFEIAPGLVYKYRGKVNKKGKVVYYGRVLWTITRFCATYCRFCTRGRKVGLPSNISIKKGATIAKRPFLSNKEIKKVVDFLRQRVEINEVILSGGDPFVTPKPYLTKIIEELTRLQKRGSLSLIRIGTRVPITSPSLIQDWHYKLVAKIRNPYLMVHINHPLELTNEALVVLNNFRQRSMATIMSQTVLLKGVNDSIDTLHELFVKMTKEGIRPYYVFQNDPVYWAHHFTVPLRRAIDIWQKLRPKLSGIAATARFAIDTPFGFGKIPLPEGNAWEVNYKFYRDFKGKKHLLVNPKNPVRVRKRATHQKRSTV